MLETMAGVRGSANDWTDFDHTGPGTLAGRYLRLFWQPVFIGTDLPAGRAKPIRIMSEDFTLYRGESGQAHCVAFRCAHRGTQLSTGWVEGDEIRCFYHGWKYDGTGQCTEQPAEPEPFCRRIFGICRHSFLLPMPSPAVSGRSPALPKSSGSGTGCEPK